MDKSDDQRDPTGKEFEARVGDAYRAIGYQVTPNVALAGKQTDLLARQDFPGGPRAILAIECKDEADPVGNTEVLAFIGRVTAQRETRDITAGVMVSAKGFTAPARATVASLPFVTLLSWDELAAEVLAVKHQLRDLVETYEISPIFSDYVPLESEAVSWTTLASASAPSPVTSSVSRWTRATSQLDRHRLLFLLADFGAGKTTLLRRIEYERAKAALEGSDPRLPLFVSLKDYSERGDITALLRAAFRDAYYRDISAQLLWRHIRDGHFYLLLDGFDEMVERSNAARRIDLFKSLLELLLSESPVALTSRPSYFVERGEFVGLLQRLRAEEVDLDQRAGARDTMGARLVARLRESDSHPAASEDAFSRHEIQVVKLLPLDRSRTELLVRHREQVLAAAGTTPDAVMAFIDRTYDLADLASRPFLLRLIIESIVVGGLDVDDETSTLGASDLYEVWTDSTLKLDSHKASTRRAGLSPDARRQLAEAMALRMYHTRALELAFMPAIRHILRNDGPLRVAAVASGLAEDEIATDFATCSFLSVSEDGMCSFIHKSFRGFFIARVLKRHLDATASVFAHPLEREVLYFLGSFAPGDPNLGAALWSAFRQATAPAARRNFLGAYLYSTTTHSQKRVEDVTIDALDFRTLQFEAVRFHNVAFNKCVFGELVVATSSWVGVVLSDTHITALRASGSNLSATLRGTASEWWDLVKSTATLRLESASVRHMSLSGTEATFVLAESRVGRLSARGSHITIDSASAAPAAPDEIDVTASVITFANPAEPGVMSATRSFVSCPPGLKRSHDWELRHSVLTFAGSDQAEIRVGDDLPPGARSSADGTSIVLADRGFSPRYITMNRSGIFGRVAYVPGEWDDRVAAGGWGVLKAGPLVHDLLLPRGAHGFRSGLVLLATDEWYERNIEEGTAVKSLQALRQLVSGASDAPEPAEACRQLAALLRAVRSEFDAIPLEGWQDLRVQTQRRRR